MSTTVSYKGVTITEVNNNTKVLETAGTWLEDDITLVDVTSGGGGTLGTKTITQNGTYNATDDDLDGYSAVTVNVSGGITPTGTKQISITQNGTITEDVTNYASAEITVNVSGGSGGISVDDLLNGTAPSGDITCNNVTALYPTLAYNTAITGFTSNSVTLIKAENTFNSCTALEKLSLTGSITTATGNYFCRYCSALESAELPNLTGNVNQHAFGGCTSLTFLDLGKTSTIQANALNGASSLTTLVLRKTSVTALQNVSAFTGTPFANGGSGGTIYVPSSLISSYQTASNWSTLHGYGTITWKAIEGSEYE